MLDPLSNRDKKLAPRLGQFWCDICDRAIVGVGGKCKICKKKQHKRRLKK